MNTFNNTYIAIQSLRRDRKTNPNHFIDIFEMVALLIGIGIVIYSFIHYLQIPGIKEYFVWPWQL